MKAIYLLAACTLALGGCAQSIHFNLPNEPLNLSVNANGAPSEHCAINPNSEQYQSLSTWLKAHQDGWKSSVASYVPGTEVTGKGFNLNFLGSFAVLNFSHRQFTHPVSPNSFDFLTCSGNP